MLDFSIWHFLEQKKRILAFDKDTTLPYEDKRRKKWNARHAQKYCISKMKDLLIKIEKLGNIAFENTALVEQDELYTIDREYVPIPLDDIEQLELFQQ